MNLKQILHTEKRIRQQQQALEEELKSLATYITDDELEAASWEELKEFYHTAQCIEGVDAFETSKRVDDAFERKAREVNPAAFMVYQEVAEMDFLTYYQQHGLDGFLVRYPLSRVPYQRFNDISIWDFGVSPLWDSAHFLEDLQESFEQWCRVSLSEDLREPSESLWDAESDIMQRVKGYLINAGILAELHAFRCKSCGKILFKYWISSSKFAEWQRDLVASNKAGEAIGLLKDERFASECCRLKGNVTAYERVDDAFLTQSILLKIRGGNPDARFWDTTRLNEVIQNSMRKPTRFDGRLFERLQEEREGR